MASHIEINGADGYKYIVVRPDTYDGPQGPENEEGNEDWSQWLRNRFSPGFANESTQWLSVLQSHGVSPRVASNSDLLFRHIAQMLRERQLAIYKVPLHSLPPGEGSGSGSGGDSDTARTGNASSGTGAPTPGGSSEAKQADTDDPGANTDDMQCQGDPVAPVTGEEILDIEDFVIDGPMPLKWVRRYRSGYCERQLGYGAGWAIPALRQVHLDDDYLWILDSEARSLRLKTLQPGEVTWQLHTGLRVERRQDNRIILTETNGTAWILASQDNKIWLPVSVQNLTGQQWRFRYDAEFRLTRLQLNTHTEVVFSYSKQHPERVQAIHLESGGQQRPLAAYSYDDHGNLLRAESDHGTEQYQYQDHLLTHRELPSGYTFHFEWLGQGPKARCLRSRGEQGHHDFQFEYQPERYLTQVHDAHGNTQVFHYDNSGRILARQDPDGALWQWAYDGLGRLMQETRPDGAHTRHRYDRKGRKAETTEPDGRSHRWHYNELGFCTAETHPDGRTHRRKVDFAGRLLSEERPDGSEWHYQYDADGWPVQATSTTGDTTELGCADTGHLLASNRNGQLQRFAFHPDGRVAGKLEQGLVTQYDYQGQRLLAVHQYPEQASEQKRSRQYQYDNAGRLTDYTTAQGDQHGYEYGPLMRPLAYRRPDGHKVQYQYDLSERLTAITRADGQQWQLGWNAQGKIDRCAAPDGRDIRFQYNAAGHITHREHPGLWAQRTERDPAGRVLTQTSQGKDRKAVTRQYRYDAFGRRTHASCADRKLHWVYNTLGQITEHHQDRHRTTYGYGPGGRIETIQLPDGTTVHYHYDPQGRWHTLSVNGDILIERTFDSQNQETTRTAGSNTQSQLHDRYGCLIKRKWQGQQSATRRYRWDAENRLEATEDSLTGSTHYQRDSQGQLTQENDTEYHYDLGGNRLPEGSQIENDRLIKVGHSDEHTQSTKRSYDALGAEIRITGQTTEHRTFDAEGQLTELKRPSLYITYGYDALGRRAWRKTDAGTTTYLWHNDVLLGEQSPKGDWQWYIRDPQTDEPLITLIDDQPYYYELDHRMMPVRLWDQEGQKVWEGNSDAWGKCQPETLNNSIHQPLRLPGQFEDELTGIVQNRFRDYDPATGRYLTPDPLGVQGGLNTYRYTRNPLDYIDPLGLSSCETSGVTPEDAMKGEEGPVGDDGPTFQNIELAGAVALARAPAPVPNLPTSTLPRVITGAAANDAVYAVERSLFSRVLPALGTAATFVTGMLYSPELGGGLEHINAPDGTVYSKHGDERIWNASGVDGSTWQTASPQEDMEYRTWLANGGEGSFEEWRASGKPKDVVPDGAASVPNNTANAKVPDHVPMSQSEYDRIINLEKGNRPEDVTDYLPQDYVDAHLEKFEKEGGAFIVVEGWIASPRPDRQAFQAKGKFVGLRSEMDEVIKKYKESGKDWRILRDELNLGENAELSNERIVYVTLPPKDSRFGYEMPTGNEPGAYEGEWVPGGYTKNGTAEASLIGGDKIKHNSNVDDISNLLGDNVERLQ